MKNYIFKGLEKLGFQMNKNINIYEEEERKIKETCKTKTNSSDSNRAKTYLYHKTVTCPVCKSTFKAIAVKSSAYKLKNRDSDLFMHYEFVNPYLYDVWACENCGYAALKADFPKIKSIEIDLVKKNICDQWKKKSYPETYDVKIAIERYKLALLNYVVMKSRSSKKGIACLKIAWMYRLLDSPEAKERELFFMNQAITGLEYAYLNEGFPIYGMDSSTIMYLLGELNRRCENYDVALKWFSTVITTRGVKERLKDLARTQKELTQESLENKPT